MRTVRPLPLVISTILSLAACAAMAGAQPPATPASEVKVLAVGNSFSRDVAVYLNSIVSAAGCKLTFTNAYIGGCPLERHVRHFKAFEKDPKAPEGSPYEINTPQGKRKVSLRDLLTSEKWQYVTIQQASIDSFKPATYRPYAAELRDYIHKYAPQAEVVVHETWAYAANDPMFSNGKMTQNDMYNQLRDAYRDIAAELGCRIIPVGDAFQNARKDPAWKFVYPDPNYDYKAPQHPKLPDQLHGLNVGYRWTKENGAWKLAFDGHHANVAGQYLGAAVWFEFFYGRSVVGNSFVPPGLTAADVAFLQKIAHETIAQQKAAATK